MRSVRRHSVGVGMPGKSAGGIADFAVAKPSTRKNTRPPWTLCAGRRRTGWCLGLGTEVSERNQLRSPCGPGGHQAGRQNRL